MVLVEKILWKTAAFCAEVAMRLKQKRTLGQSQKPKETIGFIMGSKQLQEWQEPEIQNGNAK
jgi:hypothetical protein